MSVDLSLLSESGAVFESPQRSGHAEQCVFTHFNGSAREVEQVAKDKTSKWRKPRKEIGNVMFETLHVW